MNEKINAAKGALQFVKNRMVIGLGSGSTVREFIKLLSEKVKREKWDITCIPTSTDTRIFAIENGLQLKGPDEIKRIDVAIDGADIVAKGGILKGGGGALTREKIVAYNSEKFIVIVDEGKRRKSLTGSVPIEVLQFGYNFVIEKLKQMGYQPQLRFSREKLGPAITDNGNFIIDCPMTVSKPMEMEKWLNSIPAVVENGIFTRATKIVVGTKNGFRVERF